MALGDVLPPPRLVPFLPVPLVLAEIGRRFAEQHVQRFESPRRVLGHHDPEVLQASLAGGQVAVPGQRQIAQEDDQDGQRAGQGDDQRQGFGFFLVMPAL